MLSFLCEEGRGDGTKGQNDPTVQGAGKGSLAKELSGAGETGNGEEYLTVAAQGKRVRKSTTLLAVFLGISLLCLWFMMKKSSPGTARAAVSGTEEAQIEIAIARLTGVRSEMFRGLERIVEKFYEFSDVEQVKVDELVKNPFKYETFSDDLDQKIKAEEDAWDVGAEMQLLSIMRSGQSNCCMIDDKILYEGDSIRGFKVRQISDTFVKLRNEEAEIILKLPK